jgi:hypothetical protein
MYTNVFDCITSAQVWKPLFTCRIFSGTNMCKKLQVTWQPYETDKVEDMALNTIYMHDQELWRA